MDVIKFWANRRYNAYYVEKLPLEQVEVPLPDTMDRRLRYEVNQARIAIWHGGLVRPLVVYKKDGKSTADDIYARALKGLGRTFVPAIIVDYDDVSRQDLPGKPLRSIEDAKRYFSADYAVEMTHRDFVVKEKRK